MMGHMKLVLSQSHQNDPKRRDTEQDLVASLLMQDRIEVILVEDLDQLDNESTDTLCIQGIRGDMLVVAWHSTVECIEQLRRLGVVGVFDDESVTTLQLPIALPSGQYDAMQRRIVCLDLTTTTEPTNIRQQILTLIRNSDKAVATTPPVTSSGLTELNGERPNGAVKVMPRRIDERTSSDELDLLLDEIDGFNL